MRSLLLMCLLVLGALPPAGAAPLFPDVPVRHWSRDAWATLAAAGVLEGSPDSWLRGDRAASRWEVAEILARLLERLPEQAASRTERQQLLELASAYRRELEALGVRVELLESGADRLGQRVQELERIHFYGSLLVRAGGQTFTNDGSPEMRGEVPLVDYNRAVGSGVGGGGFLPGGPAAGVPFTPLTFGVFFMVDPTLGRPLTSGSAFTTLARLGLETKLTDELTGGVEFAAFTSQGDALVDAYYGVSAPYLANPFTPAVPVGDGTQPLSHAPFSRMVLDHLWIAHEPSQARLTLGAFSETRQSPLVYSLREDPGLYGDAFPGPVGRGKLDDYGLRATGKLPVEEGTWLEWEAMATLLPDGNASPITGTSYYSHAEGAHLGLAFDGGRGQARVSFLHASNDALAGSPLAVGLIQIPNNILLHWTNPPEFFWGRLGGPGPAVGGVGSTGDVRPIPTVPGLDNDGFTGVPGQFNFGGLGPQGQAGYGLSLEYTLDLDPKPRLFLDWAHTDYRPQRGSGFEVGGEAFRAGLEAKLFEDALTVEAQFLRVEPRYDPFVLSQPVVAGFPVTLVPVPGLEFDPTRYHLHDARAFPHNREGIRAQLSWKFSERGQALIKYGKLVQVEPSLQDIRFSAGSLGPGLPNTRVLGFTPGFTDSIFTPLSELTFAPQGSNALGQALESPRGSVREFQLILSETWKTADDRDVSVLGLFADYRFQRDSRLSALRQGSPAGIRGENENFVDMTEKGLLLQAGYEVVQDLTLQAGYVQTTFRGHFTDLNGVHSDVAESVGRSRFDNVDIQTDIATLGLTWELNPKTTWGLDLRRFSHHDHLSGELQPAPGIKGLNLDFGRQAGAHPFDWSGWQVSSALSLKF